MFIFIYIYLINIYYIYKMHVIVTFWGLALFFYAAFFEGKHLIVFDQKELFDYTWSKGAAEREEDPLPIFLVFFI